MTRLDANFIPNLNDGISSERAVFRGNNYRITVLSERLLRLEYIFAEETYPIRNNVDRFIYTHGVFIIKNRSRI